MTTPLWTRIADDLNPAPEHHSYYSADEWSNLKKRWRRRVTGDAEMVRLHIEPLVEECDRLRDDIRAISTERDQYKAKVESLREDEDRERVFLLLKKLAGRMADAD